MASFRGDACALATIVVCLTTSCGRCSDEPRVPFKLPRAGDPAADAASAQAADAAVQASHVFTPIVDRPQVEGAAVAVTHVHALLESDLDGDGDRDALVLGEDDQQQPRLHVAVREPAGFAAPVVITQFTQAPAPGCGIAGAQLTPLSPGKAVATVTRACSAEAEAAPGTPLTSIWLLSLEDTPRVHERIDLPAPASEAPALHAQARSLDADGDGHDDVALDFTLDGARAPAGEPVKLVWLDRPSGLVRDGREPDATLSAWARDAQGFAATEPARAIAQAELGVTLARALCREFGAARVRVSGAAGVACGAMKSSSALLSTLVGALAKRGTLAQAFDAYRTLRDIEPPPDERTLTKAATALSQIKATAGIRLRHVSAVDVPRSPRIHLPSARFLSDASLHVRRSPAVLINLDANTESPAATADFLMRDPSGRLIATVIERSCEGHAVRIERAPPPGSDYVSSPALALASLSSATPASECARGGGRVDDGGFTLLGWAPQGLLAARGSELTLVPLASDGRPLGAPRILAPGAPRPAPLPSGVATSDASRYVEATPAGVLVYGGGPPALWRPDGYAAIAKGPLEAAISPTGRRVALVAGGSVYVLEQP